MDAMILLKMCNIGTTKWRLTGVYRIDDSLHIHSLSKSQHTVTTTHAQRMKLCLILRYKESIIEEKCPFTYEAHGVNYVIAICVKFHN